MSYISCSCSSSLVCRTRNGLDINYTLLEKSGNLVSPKPIIIVPRSLHQIVTLTNGFFNLKLTVHG